MGNRQSHPLRIDPCSLQASVYDLIHIVTKSSHDQVPVLFADLPVPVREACTWVNIDSSIKEPVARAPTLIEIMLNLSGPFADYFRHECSLLVCQLLAGDETLVQRLKIQRELLSGFTFDFFTHEVNPMFYSFAYLFLGSLPGQSGATPGGTEITQEGIT